GLASPEQVLKITRYLIGSLPGIEIGVHLHSTPDNWQKKIEAAYNADCFRYDGALKGIGGCPMANDDLVGNMNTEWMIDFFEKKNMIEGLNKAALEQSLEIASEIFV
ncbi:MAG: hydroxymethylglutaryl-CoA lyase, partial [Bacteroidota bacterium]